MKKKPRSRRHTYKKKRSIKAYCLAALLVFGIVVVSIWFFKELSAQQPSNNWFEAKSISAEGGQIVLPKDDGPHKNAITELWAYHGRLATDSGKRYGFDCSAILMAETKGNVLVNVSFDDFQSGQHYTDQTTISGVDYALEDHFEFSSAGRIMAGGNGVDHLKVVMEDFAFDLMLKSDLEPVFQGNKGVVSLGVHGNSHYYSRPRLIVTGFVSLGAKSEAIKGVAWFDHQWGDFSIKKLTWDWFGLQLADSADLMLYQVRDQTNKAVLAGGTVTENGLTDVLLNADLTLIPNAKWTSAKTGAVFPVEWRVSIPSKNMDIVTRSAIKNSEFDARSTLGTVSWVGTVSALGSHPGQGFMWLQGYTGKH